MSEVFDTVKYYLVTRLPLQYNDCWVEERRDVSFGLFFISHEERGGRMLATIMNVLWTF